MLIHGPRLVKNFAEHHRSALALMSGMSLMAYGSSVLYVVLPVILTDFRNAAWAGAFIAVFTAAQFFILDPLAGNLADVIGSRRVLQISGILLLLSGVAWLVLGSTLLGMIVLSVFAFVGWSFRLSETYLLRTTPKEEGGLIFGLNSNIMSVAYLLATLSIPFFLNIDHHWIAATIMIISSVIFLLDTLILKNDLKKSKKIIWSRAFNGWTTVKHGLHFVKKNHKVPLLNIGYKLFNGFFFGTIWFVIPLYIADLATEKAGSGLEMGIYEVVTIALAGVTGWAADHYNWRKMQIIGWLMIAGGAIALPLFPTFGGLIAAGFVIGIGNNLALYSGQHALERYDVDHREDGAFTALTAMTCNLGWGGAPLIAGFLYAQYGFVTSLLLCTVTGVSLAIWMIWLTLRLKYDKPKGAGELKAR